MLEYFKVSEDSYNDLEFNDLELHLNPNQDKENIIEIGLPEYWINKFKLSIGSIVLLRNDFPSPIIV